MKICKICKCENEDQFVYCKNCGSMLEVIPLVKKEPEVLPLSTPDEQNVTVSSLYQNPNADQPLQNNTVSVNNYSGLVPVKMLLPEPTNPEIKTVQTVYVTPAQKAAIQYDLSKNN